MLVLNFCYFGRRPYWKWLKKVPSRFFPPGILIDLLNRPLKGNNYEGFKTIPIISWFNPIFMRRISKLSSYRCDIKGSVSTVLNPIFSKKFQGQKHPGRWGIVEHQIPSIKMLFKTNTKGHKHPSIRFLSKSKTQLVNQRKQKVAFSPGTAHSPEILL